MKKISMYDFYKKIDENGFQIQLLVDSTLFSKDTIFRACYELIDKVYLYVKLVDNDYLVQFKKKSEKVDLEKVVLLFGEELIYHDLRTQIDKKSGKLREKIIQAAMGFSGSVDEIKDDISKLINAEKEFMSYENSNGNLDDEKKSIQNIISEIESDPEFQDDKDEIISLLKEIEDEEKNSKL